MKKKIMLFGLLCLTGMFYSQMGHSVGIRTANPKETLDVNGTVRLQQPGAEVKNSVLLGVDSEGKIVKRSSNSLGIDSTNTPFLYKTIKVNVPARYARRGGNPSPHVSVDTKINARKYLVTVTNFYLRRKGTNEAPSMILCSLSDGNYAAAEARDPQWNNRITSIVYRNYIHPNPPSASVSKAFGNSHFSDRPLQQKTSLLGNKLWAFHTPIFFTLPTLKLSQSGGTWHIEADFNDTQDAKNGDLVWIFDLLIVDQNWSTSVDNQN